MGTLPEWCQPLFAASAMRAIDRWAIEERGVPAQELMERAGTGVARTVEELVPDGPVAVVCGKGNNGGDGLVAARVLREAGRETTVFAAAAAEEWKGDAWESFLRLSGEPPVAFGSGVPLGGFAVVIDALLGTGFSGEPRGATAEAIDAIDGAVDAGVPVVSVDVPSGADASTGEVSARAVRATATVTFHAAKIGLWVRPGKAHAGEVRTLDIGIPRGAPVEADAGLIDPSVLALLPRRGPSSTKFSSGHVLVAGGSRGLTGAPLMAAHAAMRAGAGYVTACVPASVQAILAAGGLPELMTRGLPDEDGSLTAAGVEEVLDGLRRGGALALALGPGLGRGPGAEAFARELALRSSAATVIDADGLNAYAGRLGDLAAREAPTVLTPHAGELGRLLELPSEEIERERLRHARAAAELSKAVVVLKGDDTLIAAPSVSSTAASSAVPSGAVAVSRGESPALATAGTGDVLTGVIAALLAQGLDPFTAAAAGVHLHAVAGRIAAHRTGAAEGVTATDVIAALPAARAGAGEL
jgi:ADP-dependent NAD(P)H-hydrate dehydratase / NAD(P)H-hydrate epimerase